MDGQVFANRREAGAVLVQAEHVRQGMEWLATEKPEVRFGEAPGA